MDNLVEIYEEKINAYTEKYAKKHHITKEDAKEHVMVKYYREFVYKTRGGE